MTTLTFGKYVVTERLGHGGMAEVYQAHDPILDRHVAIKVVLPHLATETGFAERFLREAKLVASLRHPHIVQIFDFDLLDDRPFMVMECLTGGTLKARLMELRARSALMPLADVVHLLDALADALDYAHACGTVHRDIKPANILFTTGDTPVLTDFGIAKLLDQTAQMSATGSILGTPAYMSPEQAAGKPVDARSDLYSLGIVVYELTTGSIPFHADTPTAILLQHLSAEPPDPRQFNQNLPVPLAQTILRALAKEPDARFASAGDFAQALRAAMIGKTVANPQPEDVTVVERPQPAPWPTDSPPPATLHPQDFLTSMDLPMETATLGTGFVARDRELAQLQIFLARAWAGQGQICFVAGEAGVGKTALVTEFARRTQRTHPELVVAIGNCNTQSGLGDPYLPFRELLSSLMGLTATGLTTEARALQTVAASARDMKVSVQALAEHGLDLIDVFVPSGVLLGQLAQRPTADDWADRLEALVQHHAQAAVREAAVEQGHIFEQYTNVLKAMAAQHPLLLILDDLQWIDAASADLLFHLSRRIRQDRILLVGTHRPDEVRLGRSGDPHPLEKTLAELKRYFGEIQIVLQAADQKGGRQFVDALLDIYPNRLDERFRQALVQHTGGHALFTVELLRHLQERGDLTQDETALWVAKPTLDWKDLPPRVEGVIEERIGRLTDELRQVLTVASVEGENFTAEVVARVQRVDVRALVRQLSNDLERQHRLVGTAGRQRVGQQRLSLFRFQHNLFQKYLYHNLNAAERAYFHEDIGTVLEELYGDAADEIAVQLAWHFTEADLPERSRRYLVIAGEQARRRYANAEALSYLNRALDLTLESDDVERYTLQLAREKIHDVLGDREAQRLDLAQLAALAQRLNDPQRQAEVALCHALYAVRIGQYREAKEHAQKAIELAASVQDVQREAKGYQLWGRALVNLSDYVESQAKLEQALALANAGGLVQVNADSLRTLGVISYFLGDYNSAAATYQQALAIYRDMADRRSEAHVLSNLGLAFREQGKYAEARLYFDGALQIYQEIGDRAGEAHLLNNLGLLSRDQGDYGACQRYYTLALEISRDTSGHADEAESLMGLGDVHKDHDEFAEASAYYREALQTYHDIGDRRFENLARKELADVAISLGDYITALSHLGQALDCFRQIGDRQSECATLNRLGLLYHQSGDDEAARTNSQAALDIARQIGDKWLESSSLTKLGHALVGLGQMDTASDCYRQAIALWREQGRPDLALESVAGLARIALNADDLQSAQTYAEEMMTEFADETFPNDGMDEEFLTCYQVLQANGDERAAQVLATIYHQVQETAAHIDDETMRHSYLEKVPAHREIETAWQLIQAQTGHDRTEWQSQDEQAE